MIEQLRVMGMDEAQIAAAAQELFAGVAEADGDLFTVYGVNAAAVRLFSALQSQWRTASLSTMGRAEIRRTGFDYGVVEATARLEGLDLALPADFRRLRVMEAEALRCMAEQQAAAK